MFKKIVLTCLLATLSLGVLAKSGYYRWLDDSGHPQFTQKPPLDRPSKFVPLSRSFSSDEVNPASPQPVPAKRADSAPPEQEPQQLEIMPDKNPERCAQAKSALQSFSRGQRVRVKDDTGEARILSKEEVDTQKERAQELVKIYC